jgi:hypothetical protein
MIYQLNYDIEYLGLVRRVLPAKSKYADSKSSAYLRGTWLKTKKYQTVILAYLPAAVRKYANYCTLQHTILNIAFPQSWVIYNILW